MEHVATAAERSEALPTATCDRPADGASSRPTSSGSRRSRRQPGRCRRSSDRRDGDRSIDGSPAGDGGDGDAASGPSSPASGRCGSSCRRGRSATRARGSRSSPSRASPGPRTRRSTTRPRSTAITGAAPTVALHIPWDKVDDYADLGPPCRGRRGRPRDDQLERLPGRRLHARERLPSRSAGPPEGPRPPPRVRRHHGRDRLARPQAVVRRRDELPGPGRHPRPPGPSRRGPRRGLRPARRRPADGPRVQALRAVVLHDGRARLGDRVRPLPAARREGQGRGRHRPPRARARTSSSSSRSSCARASSARSTSTRGSTPTTT